MLHIVLTILAVIGKILLGFLAFILLILLLVLLVPIRYKGTFQNQGKKMKAAASVSWLLRLVFVQVSWIEKQVSFEVYLLGIPLFRFLKWIKGRKKRTRKKSGTTEKESLESNTETMPEQESLPLADHSQQEITVDEGMPEPLVEESGDSAIDTGETPSEQAVITEGNEENNKAGILQKVKSVFSKISGLFRKFSDIPNKVSGIIKGITVKLRSVKEKGENLKEKADKVLKLLQSKLFKDVFALAKKEVLAILRHILPQKIEGRIEYGTGDPGTTGEILAVIAAVYPVLPNKLVIRPDFDEAVLNTDLSLKGRIRLVVLLFHGAKLILNKKVRHLIKKVRHKEA